MKIQDLLGKTIEKIEKSQYKKFDDEFVKLIFTDGTICYLFGGFGDYSGESLDEYPTYVGMSEDLKGVIDSLSYKGWDSDDDLSTFEEDFDK